MMSLILVLIILYKILLKKLLNQFTIEFSNHWLPCENTFRARCLEQLAELLKKTDISGISSSSHTNASPTLIFFVFVTC